MTPVVVEISTFLRQGESWRPEMLDQTVALTFCSAPCRENHDEDKPALNSIADNTVAMEVT